MHPYIIGIDPGLDGALALTGPAGFISFFDVATISAPGSTKRRYDELGMVASLRGAARLAADPPGPILVVLEKVHAMPKQGVTSVFTFGTGYGIWLGIIAALGLPSVRVDPRTWKKVCLVDVPKDDVAAQAGVAGRWYPLAAPALRTPRGRVLDGRVDALLLAHYARVSGL